MRSFFRKLRWLRRRDRKEAELREELEFHLEEDAEEREAEGLASADARRAARVELGNLTALRENTRAAWGWTLAEQVIQDLRYAARNMSANRLFTLTAVVSLALGIGANTALYSLLESIVLRPLPVGDPGSLVLMKWRSPAFPKVVKSFSLAGTMTNSEIGGTVSSAFPYAALPVFESNRSLFAAAFCYGEASGLTVAAAGQNEVLDGQYVSGDYFPGMRIGSAAGRLIGPEDDRPGAAPVAVLNYRYVRQRFGEAARAIGETVRINDQPFTVIGVTPPGFFGADAAAVPDVWLPIQAGRLLDPISKNAEKRLLDRNFYWTAMMARLQPGVSLGQAQAVMEPQFRQFAESTATSSAELQVLPTLIVNEGAAGMDSLAQTYARPLYVMLAMAGLILLIACINLSNLLLARAIARRREVAVRLSIGAGRMRVVRQLLTESVLLACAGGALGLGVAYWCIRILSALLSAGRGNLVLRADLNWQVLGVAFALSVFTGLLFGLAPALQATRGDLIPALKELRADLASMRRFTMGRLLLAGQIALSLLLLVAAGLFGRTLTNLNTRELGFRSDNVLLFSLNPRVAGYSGDALTRVCLEVRDRLKRIPGVQEVSLSNAPLLAGSGTSTSRLEVPGAAQTPTGAANRVGLLTVGPKFFETMGVPVLAGREFDGREERGGVQPVIVNERLVRAFGLENPIGRTVTLKPNTYQIVGVVGDALFLSIKEERFAMLYFAFTGQPSGRPTFEMRVAGNPVEYAKATREVVRQVDSRFAPAGLEAQSTQIERAINREITLARLCTAFGVLALVIACVGLYGTAAFHASRRTREIGIRMALGAQRRTIVWSVLREVFVSGVVGLAVGLGGALYGARSVATLLYGIRPNDPLVLTACAAILLAAALLAGYLPARRAASVDPTAALRHE